MKKLLIALGVSAAMVSGSALAAPLKHDEQKDLFVRSSGKVLGSTCHYTSPSNNGILEVSLGEHEQNQLNATGHSAATAFDFTFTQCPSNISEGKSGLKMWVRDNHLVQDAKHGLLKNSFNNPDRAAQNVFVQILDSTGNPLEFGNEKGVTQDFTTEKNGTIKFDFQARLSAPKNNASSGEVEAYAPFVVEYK